MSAATTITDAFQLPGPDDIRAMGFVIRLREAAADSDEVRQLVKDYVVTPAVAAALPTILRDLRQVRDRGEEYGRFIHGSFGSGKSHFMTMLSLLIEGAPAAWQKFADLTEHRDWLEQSNLLVVRIHMLSVRGRSTGLDRIVYDSFNAALARRGKEQFAFLNVEALFDEVRREVAEYGDVVWERLAHAGIVGGAEDFEALAVGSEKGRERLARAWLAHKGRDAAQAGIDPRWTDGLHRMSEHAKAQGFGGVVLMIDEFLLWLAEKSGEEFVREINDLNVIVDHNTGQRAAPVFVFVARQRNLKEFFPDLVDETKIHEHIDHHAKRFELTKLQDVELRHIVRGRVLRPRMPEAVAAVVDDLARHHGKILPGLMAGADVEYLRDVYPFHPALIEMLVDVTSLMQRERSALRLLYELLVIHYPDLPLGEFLPVGSAFAAIFPESGVEASKKVEVMQSIHHEYYSRLAPAMQQMEGDAELALSEGRVRALDQMVKTVLLAEVSPRLKQGGLTVERLVQLNAVDMTGETARGTMNTAYGSLMALSQRVSELQVAGTGKTALVKYILGKVNLGEILARARSKVDNNPQRFGVFWPTLIRALGLQGERGFDNAARQGAWTLTWRRTRRAGAIKLGNVREMAYGDFVPPDGAFKVMVDYPWDEPGHTVDEDRHRALNARKERGALYTVCWLPRHFTVAEVDVLTEIAALQFIQTPTGQEELLGTFGPGDRDKVMELAQVREVGMRERLETTIREVYVNHGEFCPLIGDLDTKFKHPTLAENLTHIAEVLMDRQFPRHPHFGATPDKAGLGLVLEWMVEAANAAVSVAFSEEKKKALRLFAEPLELVNLGQTRASIRLDSRYIKDVLQRTDKDSVSWDQVKEHLAASYGFQPLVLDLFLCFLCARDHRALRADALGEPVDVAIGMKPVSIRLQKGKVVDGAAWGRVRDLGHTLFGLPRPSAHRSLSEQDRWARTLTTAGGARRVSLSGLHARLVELGVEDASRLTEIQEAQRRLAPLDARAGGDSGTTLQDLSALWPSGAEDVHVGVVQGVEGLRDALADLDGDGRKHLLAGREHPALGVEVRAHLDKLAHRMKGSHATHPIDSKWVGAWNRDAQALIARLIQRPPTPDLAPLPPVPPVVVVTTAKELLATELDPSNPDELSLFGASVRKALQQVGAGKGRVVLTWTPEAE